MRLRNPTEMFLQHFSIVLDVTTSKLKHETFTKHLANVASFVRVHNSTVDSHHAPKQQNHQRSLINCSSNLMVAALTV